MKLPQSWQLPEEIKNRLGQKSFGKQRAMVAEGHLLLILHKVPQKDRRSRQGVFFWRKPSGEWEFSGRGRGLPALRKHLEEYGLAEEQLNQAYDRAREARDYFEILEAIAPLQRAAGNLHATLQAAREAISSDRDIIDLRDRAAEIDRALELLRGSAKTAIDFKIAKQAEEQATLSLQSVKTAHRLNILAAIFFPLTAISCVFGMNLPSGFESASIGLFWLVFLTGTLLGVLVRRWAIEGRWF